AGAGGVAALLAACGGSSPAPAAVSARPAQLILNTDWVGSTPRGQVTERALAEFQGRFPHLKVTPEPLAENTVEKLTALIAGDSIGDVSLWTHHLVVYFARRSFFTDLRPYLKTFKYSFDDIYSIKEIVEYEGKLIAVPFQLNLFDWIYNKTLFKQAGVQPPADSWTWDQFVTTARRLTDPEKKVWGMEWTVNHPNWMTTIWANGGTLLDATFARTTLAEPPAAEAIELTLDLVHKHQVAPVPAMHRELQLGFARGTYAMTIGNSPGRALDKQLADLGEMEWDFCYMPAMPRTSKRTVQANLQPYVVPATRRETREQAVQLAFFMGGDFVQGLIADTGAATPTWTRLIDSDRYLVPAHRRKVVLDGHAYRKGMGSNFEHYVPWRTAVEAELTRGWNGEQSARDTALKATAAGDAALAASKNA
ncbi:MAG TPA: extracellular solute-binding protein, partial [Chloroflexota bacterium]|nr:extracellular solute-binding protein [Chloroflexota bacterium]